MRARPKVSLCMIARDEEQFLAACLESVRGVVDQIVVVDTGSKDSTVSIAKQFGAQVVHYAWNDHFAEARNRALEAATGRWILALDADEQLDPETAPRIRQAIAAADWEAGLLHFANKVDGAPETRFIAPRLFRFVPGMHYVGRIHEQMVQGLPLIRHRLIDATVYHYGYQRSVFSDRQKRARNTRLLERALQDPEAQEPLLRSNYLFHHAHMFTGKELLARFGEFAAYVREKWPEGPPIAPWITAGLAEYARLLSDVGRHQEAGRVALELLERRGESPLLRYVLARSRAAEGSLEAAEKELAEVLRPTPQISAQHLLYVQDLALVQGRARFLLGLMREKQEKVEEAAWLYQAAVEEEPDQDVFRCSWICALVRLGRYQQAVEALEASPTLVGRPQPGMDCLGFVLALLTKSPGRLVYWGEKVRQLAEHPWAARLFEQVSRLGAQWNFRLEDFPELASEIVLRQEPGQFRMPPTVRKSAAMPAGAD